MTPGSTGQVEPLVYPVPRFFNTSSAAVAGHVGTDGESLQDFSKVSWGDLLRVGTTPPVQAVPMRQHTDTKREAPDGKGSSLHRGLLASCEFGKLERFLLTGTLDKFMLLAWGESLELSKHKRK
eukprot:CAMPEP_0197656694 /NCGR_PEP_ID=MMETSP1338-20131121/42941_1 /TAXON_ID=43686 ORGANISM="Pelagodinium beii, Strain RCC1491" /NCGR_SAMPLE_ID=MMETSP1338 /ASSEMBLY_ACC=CAM_ASM_000754 /LENGTH=123 /DNA_ID=CAMNT_0043232817 /DNA_START=59 /DNA_END=430 /DNA_ORIENTATION=-